jgi:hypothetical protein
MEIIFFLSSILGKNCTAANNLLLYTQPQRFRVKINDTNPLVYYCSQGARGGGHCQEGMVGVVNVAPGSDALQQYVKKAATVELAGNPTVPAYGGTFVPASASSGEPSTSTSAASPTSSVTTVPSTAAGEKMGSSLGGGLAVALVGLLLA